MTDDPKRPSRTGKKGRPPWSLSDREDEAILEARAAIGDGLIEYLNDRLQVSGGAGSFEAALSEGMLISVLELIAPDGKYPMDKGRFWQILDRHCPFPPLETEDSVRERLMTDIQTLFAAAEYEGFEDGFDSVLSLEIQRLVLEHGDAALDTVSDLIAGDRVAPEAAAEALACLGEMEHKATHEARRRVLERGLKCSSHVARDGAVVGLSDLGDPRSVPALEAAAQREEYRMLRANMLELVEQLRGHDS
jgi:hypothetical protein